MGVQNLSGQTFGHYELRDLLGVGGMGAVYRAYQSSLKREVAIKVLPVGLAVEPDYVQRFQREAETAASLEHPHIIPIYDYGVEQGTTYIAMRLLTGGTLADRMLQRETNNRPLPSLGEIAALLRQIAGAFDYAHSRGVIHRDIKPSNIMFDHQGNAFLVDFGIAKLLASTSALTSTGAVMGTPLYMAPEQWRAELPTASTDQYALGVTTYQLLTGRVPFEAPTPYGLMIKHLNETPTAPHIMRPDLSQDLTLTLERAMAKDPTQRFHTMTAFAQAFEGAVAGHPGEGTQFFTIPVARKPTAMTVATHIPEIPPARSAEVQGASPPAATLPSGHDGKSFHQRPLVWVGALVLIAVLAAAGIMIVGGGGNKEKATRTPVAFAPTETPSITPTRDTGIVILPSSTSALETAIAITPSITPGTSPSPEPGVTPETTNTIVPSETPTAALTDTLQPTTTPPPTAKPSDTLAPTVTPSLTNSPEPTATLNFTATRQAIVSLQMTETAESATDTPTPNLEATVQALAVQAMTGTAESWTDTPTSTPSATPTFTPSPTDTPFPTNTLTPTASPTISLTHTPVPTFTPFPTATSTPTALPSATPFGGGSGLIAFVSERDGNREIYVMNSDGSRPRRLTNDPANDRDPACSPQGNQIAFYSERGGNAELYIMNLDGSNLRNLSNNPANEYHPAWSPDGLRIAFSSNRDGNEELYMMNTDSSHVTRLTDHSASDGGPTWSPDGQWIAFGSNRDGNSELYMMNLPGGDPIRLTYSSGDDGAPAWSPDGRQIAFMSNRDGNWEVYVIDIVNNTLRNLTNAPSNDWWPEWSADGTQLAFISDRDGIGEIYLMDSDGRVPRRLTDPSAWNDSPSWCQATGAEPVVLVSPSVPTLIPAAPTSVPTLNPSMLTPTPVGGGWGQIAYVSDREGMPVLYLINSDGTANQRLTDLDARADNPAWLPDGQQIVFSSNQDGNDEIYLLDIGTPGVFTRLTNNPASDLWPVAAPDGSGIAFMTDRDGNTEIYRMDLQGGSVQRLTNHPAADRFPDWSPDATRLVFQSERDGNPELYMMNADGSSVRRLTSEPAEERFPAWSPDGQQIVFQSRRDGNSEIYLLQIDSLALINLTNNPAEDRFPAWSSDGSQIVFQSERDGNRELYTMSLDGSNLRRLTQGDANDWRPVWRPAPPPCQLVFSANINIRTGAGTTYEVLGPTTPGVNLYVTGRSEDNTWWRVVYSGHTGWVAGNLASVRVVGDCSNIPTIP